MSKLWLCVLGLAACAGEATSNDGTTEALTYAPTTNSFAGVVTILNCTATMLSEHWVLTAAHCVVNGPQLLGIGFAPSSNGLQSPDYLYAGSAVGYRDPSWGGSEDWDASHDIGLLQLTQYGVDVSKVGGRAMIVTNTDYPGVSGNPTLGYMAGWGLGSDAAQGSSSNCDDAKVSGILRWTAQSVSAYSSTLGLADAHRHCPGDSGGPWLFRYLAGATPYYLQFAVHHGYGAELFDWDSVDQGAFIEPARPWMESVMSTHMPYFFRSASADSSVAGHPYRQYFETPPAPSAFSVNSHEWCMTATGPGQYPVQLGACNGSSAQSWSITETGEIHNAAYPAACLDVNGGTPSNGTILQLWDCNQTLAQRFAYNYDLSIHSGQDGRQCLDATSYTQGGAVQTWTCSGSGEQSWSFGQCAPTQGQSCVAIGKCPACGARVGGTINCAGKCVTTLTCADVCD